MERGEPYYMFSPTSLMLHPPPPLPLPLPLPSQEDHQIFAAEDIDWVSLFSGGSGPGQGGGSDQKPPRPSGLVDEVRKNIIDKGKGGESLNNNEKGKDGINSCGSSRGKVIRRGRRKALPQRVAFHTRSSEDVLDDGYKWRKYGQKAVKNTTHPRSYYRCTHHTCAVKKQIQRLSRDTGIVVTTYEGIHNHPSEKLMETLTPILKQIQFLSRF